MRLYLFVVYVVVVIEFGRPGGMGCVVVFVLLDENRFVFVWCVVLFLWCFCLNVLGVYLYVWFDSGR